MRISPEPSVAPVLPRRQLLNALPALLLMLAACTPAGDNEAVDFLVPITAQEVTLGSIEDRVIATGTLRAHQVITLTAESAGILEILPGTTGRPLAEGDAVQAGTRLARVTGEDARIAVRREVSQKRFDAARQDLEAAQKLRERGLISQKELKNLQTAFEDAKLELDRSLHTEQRNQIVTPIDGVIQKLGRNSDGQYMSNGQLVATGQVIAQVAPTDVLIADVDLVGRDLARVVLDTPARVRYHAFGAREFPGTLRRFAPMIDERTRALRAEVEVANADGVLRPGMFVEVTLIVERRDDVPLLPRQAVTVRGGQPVVFALSGQRALQRAVTLGLGDDRSVEITSGVQAGDRIIVSGLETLADQTRVRETR
ncbi:MAG: efflux RND transporter periplasmic adaptor subunit [Gammaproteobacteria bacterium]|nr:efflux RND transporter periplasmic adaptor subunit [Gammaproteobacteria bacterium]